MAGRVAGAEGTQGGGGAEHQRPRDKTLDGVGGRRARDVRAGTPGPVLTLLCESEQRVVWGTVITNFLLHCRTEMIMTLVLRGSSEYYI